MSRKTKAELEAENKWLQTELRACRDMVNTLQFLLDGADLDRAAWSKAEEVAVAEYLKLHNRAARMERERNAGIDKINERTAQPSEYVVQQYRYYREQNVGINRSREKANEDAIAKFPDFQGYSQRHLQRKLKD
jgi:hypothetical protein